MTDKSLQSRFRFRSTSQIALLALGSTLYACSSSSNAGSQGGAGPATGGAQGGSTAQGGSATTGGTAATQGGSTAQGGTAQGGSTAQGGGATGGNTTQGGSMAQGGGAPTGGSTQAGGAGATNSGGSSGAAQGGSSTQGGNAGTAGASGATATGGQGGSTGKAGAVWTNRYDNVRTGATRTETTLTVANVGGGKFGLLFSRAVEGHVYAQPLYLPGLSIGGKTRNVLFVATEHNMVYAFDADDAAQTSPLWSKSLGTPMRTYPGIENQPVMAPNTVSCRDMYPETGVTSTPVIDQATGRMYVVSKNFENNTYSQRLHALDVLTGQEVSGSPVTIQGSVPGSALDGNGSMVPFDPFHHMNRVGLLLLGGNVYIAFASHCDDEPYHGWIFAYAADSLTQKGIFCTTPNGGTSMNGSANAGLGGIWQSGMGLVADGASVYFAAGNGAFDSGNKGAQLGISVGRLQLDATGFKVMDWFTPSNAKAMNDQDLDYTTAPVLIPSPKVMMVGGKDGFLNVLDPANLGKLTGASGIIQQYTVGGHSHGSPVYWNGPSGSTVYVWPEKSSLRAFRFNGNKLNTTAASSFTGDTPTHPGGTLSLSANEAMAGTGILWATFTSTRIDTTSGRMGDAWHYLVPGALYAFDANSLSTPIWTSIANKTRDDLGVLAKFNAPVVANGKVYVAAQVAPPSDTASTAGGKIQVYGILP